MCVVIRFALNGSSARIWCYFLLTAHIIVRTVVAVVLETIGIIITRSRLVVTSSSPIFIVTRIIHVVIPIPIKTVVVVILIQITGIACWCRLWVITGVLCTQVVIAAIAIHLVASITAQTGIASKGIRHIIHG